MTCPGDTPMRGRRVGLAECLESSGIGGVAWLCRRGHIQRTFLLDLLQWTGDFEDSLNGNMRNGEGWGWEAKVKTEVLRGNLKTKWMYTYTPSSSWSSRHSCPRTACTLSYRTLEAPREKQIPEKCHSDILEADKKKPAFHPTTL